MIAQSTVLLNVNIDKGKRAFNSIKQETHFDLNNYVYGNSLYFSDDVFKSVEELQKIIEETTIEKERILEGKNVDEEQLEKDIKIMQKKVGSMRNILKNDLL